MKYLQEHVSCFLGEAGEQFHDSLIAANNIKNASGHQLLYTFQQKLKYIPMEEFLVQKMQMSWFRPGHG